MLSKSKFCEAHRDSSQTFLASKMLLISENPKFFSFDSLAPEGLLSPADAKAVSSNLLLHRGSLFTPVQMKERLDKFIDSILRSKPNKGDHPSHLIFKNPEPVDMSNRPTPAPQVSEAKGALADLDHVTTLKLKSNPHQIVVGGGFFLSESIFSFKEQSESPEQSDCDSDASDKSRDSEGAFIRSNPERVHNDFLEMSKDSVTLEFESLLVTEQDLKRRKKQEQQALLKKDEELEKELGQVCDRKFVVTYIGHSQTTKSDPLNMDDLIYFFDRVQDRSCFLITNTWRNRVYQFYFFVNHIFQLIKDKVARAREPAPPGRDPAAAKSRKSSCSIRPAFPVTKKTPERILSPLKQHLSRGSGEQLVRQNNLSMNKNLSSISPSHVSNGSLNAISFFNVKPETGGKTPRRRSEEKKLGSLGSLSKEGKATARLKPKTSAVDEYGVYQTQPPAAPAQPDTVTAPVQACIKKNFLLEMLEVKPVPKQTPPKTESNSNTKKKMSLKSRIRERKIKQGQSTAEHKPRPAFQEFHPNPHQFFNEQAHWKPWPGPVTQPMYRQLGGWPQSRQLFYPTQGGI